MKKKTKKQHGHYVCSCTEERGVRFRYDGKFDVFFSVLTLHTQTQTHRQLHKDTHTQIYTHGLTHIYIYTQPHKIKHSRRINPKNRDTPTLHSHTEIDTQTYRHKNCTKFLYVDETIHIQHSIIITISRKMLSIYLSLSLAIAMTTSNTQSSFYINQCPLTTIHSRTNCRTLVFLSFTDSTLVSSLSLQKWLSVPRSRYKSGCRFDVKLLSHREVVGYFLYIYFILLSASVGLV